MCKNCRRSNICGLWAEVKSCSKFWAKETVLPKERGMIFNAEMVKALLDGRKVQTRRPMKVKPDGITKGPTSIPYKFNRQNHPLISFRGIDEIKCPFGKVGDRIYVRETFCFDNKDYVQTYKDETWRGLPDRFTAETFYRATEEIPDMFPRWTPSIHMPRWASRITLEITNVRVERLQEISEEDAKSEGVNGWHPDIPATRASHKDVFHKLWDSIYGSWSANPWVWVVEFKVI